MKNIFQNNANISSTQQLEVMSFVGNCFYVKKGYIIIFLDGKRVETNQHLPALPLDDQLGQYHAFPKGKKDAPGKLAVLALIS